MTIPPRVAARLYAGAVEATPMTTLETSPKAPDLRPLPPSSELLGRADTASTVMYQLQLLASRLCVYRSFRRLAQVVPRSEFVFTVGIRRFVFPVSYTHLTL